MNIQERLTRGEEEDLIYLGQVVEEKIGSEFWKLLEAVTLGRKSAELRKSIAGAGSADRVLGRLEAYETIMSDLENFFQQKQALTSVVIEEENVVDEGSQEQTQVKGRVYPTGVSHGGHV